MKRWPSVSVLSFLVVLVLYGLSFVGHSQSWLGTFSSLLLVGTFGTVLWRWPAVALAFLVSELAATSFGRLFPVPWVPQLSLRVCLLLLASVSGFRSLAFSEIRNWLKPYRWPLAGVVVVVGWGIVRGLLTDHSLAAIIDDANGYATLFLLPFVVVVFRRPSDRQRVMAAAVGAASAMALLTVFLFIWFLLPVSDVWRDFVYRWVRDIRLGEITPRLGPPGSRRVFLQSQLWAGALLFWLAVQKYTGKRAFFWSILCASLLGTAVVIGGSRTIWAAALVTAFLLGGRLLLQKTPGRFQTASLVLVIAVLAGVAVPGVLGGRLFLDKTSARATQVLNEPAIDSRVQLLSPMVAAITSNPFFGQGFGTALTYTTRDPRLLAERPDGQFTTTAFEWGWLDLWLKMGILGPVIFAWLLGTVLWRAWKKPTTPEEVWSGAIVLFLAVAHVFSPWLNHPLGLGLLVLALVLTESARLQTLASPEAVLG